jgi:hypothetical protein
MIYHEKKLINMDKTTVAAIKSFQKNIGRLDVFIIAADKKSSDNIKQMEKVAGGTFTKAAWTKSVANGEGVILTVNSKYFRRRATKPVLAAIETVKKQFEGLTFEQVDHKKFAAFFIAYKSKAIEEPVIEKPA